MCLLTLRQPRIPDLPIRIDFCYYATSLIAISHCSRWRLGACPNDKSQDGFSYIRPISTKTFYVYIFKSKDQLRLGADDRGFLTWALSRHLPSTSRLHDGRTWTSCSDSRSHLAGGAHLRFAIRYLHWHLLRALSTGSWIQSSRSESDRPGDTRIRFLLLARRESADPMASNARSRYFHILYSAHGHSLLALPSYWNTNKTDVTGSW